MSSQPGPASQETIRHGPTTEFVEASVPRLAHPPRQADLQ